MNKVPTLRSRAVEIYDLIDRLDNIFKNAKKENTIALIMLAIEDGYRQGKADALAPPEVEE